MDTRATLSLLLAIGLCSCNYQGEAISVSLLCKKVSTDNSNAVYFAIADVAKEFGYQMVVNREEIELAIDRAPRPFNRELMFGILKNDGRYVMGFSSTEIDKNAYTLSFYERTKPEFRDRVLAEVTEAIAPEKTIEISGNSVHSKQCSGPVLIE